MARVFSAVVPVPLAASAITCSSEGFFESSRSSGTTVRVSAERAWTDTGIDVQIRDVVTIEARSGEWSPWPGDGYDALGSGGDPRCDCNVIAGVSHAALIGKIGEGPPFLVGSEFSRPMGESGRLYLGINDTRLDDNSGSIRVTVRVEPP
ncbi:MAG: hypothetical protein AB1449_02390 [Chloroflexota bacterium]